MYIAVARARQRALTKARAAGIPPNTLEIDNEIEDIFVALLRDSGTEVSETQAKTSEKEFLDKASFAWVPGADEEDDDDAANSHLWRPELPEDAIDPTTGQLFSASVSMRLNASRIGDDAVGQGRRRAVAVVSGLDPFAFPASQWAAKYKENMQSPSREQIVRGGQTVYRSSMILDDNFKKYIASGGKTAAAPKERALPVYSRPTLVVPVSEPTTPDVRPDAEMEYPADDSTAITMDTAHSSNSNSVHFTGGVSSDIALHPDIQGHIAVRFGADSFAVRVPADSRMAPAISEAFDESEVTTTEATGEAPTAVMAVDEDAQSTSVELEVNIVMPVEEPDHAESAPDITIAERPDMKVDEPEAARVAETEHVLVAPIAADESNIPGNDVGTLPLPTVDAMVPKVDISERENVDAGVVSAAMISPPCDIPTVTVIPPVSRPVEEISNAASEVDKVVPTGRFARPREIAPNVSQTLKKFQRFNEIPNAGATMKYEEISDDIGDTTGDQTAPILAPSELVKTDVSHDNVVVKHPKDVSYLTGAKVASQQTSKVSPPAQPIPVEHRPMREADLMPPDLEPFYGLETFSGYLPPLSNIAELPPKKPVSPIITRKSSKTRQEIESELKHLIRQTPTSRFENPSVSLTMSKNPSVATAAIMALQLAESKSMSSRLSSAVKRLYTPTGSRSVQSLPSSARNTPTGTIRPKSYLHVEETDAIVPEDGNSVASADGFSAVLKRVVGLSNGPLIAVTGASLSLPEDQIGNKKLSKPPLGSTKRSDKGNNSSKQLNSDEKSYDSRSMASHNLRLETDSLGDRSMSTIEPPSPWNVNM